MTPLPRPSIVGRDDFIADTWRQPASKSLYMNDLRRIGKTRILDMNLIQPGPLAPAAAASFANSEIVRRELRCAEPEACAAALAAVASHVPFYIEKLVARLPRDASVTPELIEAELEKELRSDNTDWDLDYYRRRVKAVFPETEKLVLAVLDAIAVGTKALPFQELGKHVRARMETDDDVLREHLKLLCMDHYLVRDDDNGYRFYLSLIRRWWKIDRSL